MNKYMNDAGLNNSRQLQGNRGVVSDTVQYTKYMIKLQFSVWEKHFKVLIGQTITKTNRTYAYNLVLTAIDTIVIEAAWKIYKGSELYLDIKTGDYDNLSKIIDVLASQKIEGIEVTEDSYLTVKIYFSNNYSIEVYLKEKYDNFWVQTLSNKKSYLLTFNKDLTVWEEGD